MGPILGGAATLVGGGLPGWRAPDTAGLPSRVPPQPGELAVAVARHDPEGWKVVIMCVGQPALALWPSEARQIAADLSAYADICDGKWGE